MTLSTGAISIFLCYHLQKGNSWALEVLDHLAAKGDILPMERVSLYYFDKCQFSKAFLSFKALHEKTSWQLRTLFTSLPEKAGIVTYWETADTRVAIILNRNDTNAQDNYYFVHAEPQ